MGDTRLGFNCSRWEVRTGIAADLCPNVLRMHHKTVFEGYGLTRQVINFERISTSAPNAEGMQGHPVSIL